ncbi:RNA polymerase-associated protein CTR9 homolog isoform X2 [Drosophila biarmipes]|uniref:RNA polymerase-associated protein CTR9 homolog isoform X2 n=1 Tax=Drosophila biarmipes TaxID=125945 RepID=UPI0007E82239|nr:RNA polymerase-associated protein CTR9 homolog isoform X2 [Drosophila biarmipes]
MNAFKKRSQRNTFARLLEAGIKKCTTPYRTYKEDLIKANTLLAACFTNMAYKEQGKLRRALQAKLVNLFDSLEGCKGFGNLSLQLIKGFALMLSPSTAREADALFVGILRKKSDSILALVGRGCLAFNRQDYIGSLGFFKSVLMAQPQAPAEVRVGMAHCFLRMGDLNSARRSFERALELNKRCPSALLGRAILKLNQRDPALYREGIDLLNAAFESDKRHPEVLSILATYYYSIGDHPMVLRLAGNAMRFTDIPELKSHICYQVARSHHATGAYDFARTYYQNAQSCAPKGYVLPLMGLAQLHLRNGEFGEARTCLETFLKALPNESSALRLLAMVYLNERSPGTADKAIQMLLHVVRKPSGSQEWDSWLNLALAYEQKGLWESAINAYEEAKRIILGQGLHIPIEWLNNQAASQMLAKQPQGALTTLNEAFSQLGSQEDNPLKSTNYLTMRYNYARVLEDLRMYDQAQLHYEDIIVGYPGYHDCHLRLGIMAMQWGELSRALEHFKDVLAIDYGNIAARTYLGDCFMKMRLSKQSLSNYSVILRSPGHSQDSYALMALGNFYLKKCQNNVMKGDLSSAKRNQENALNFYSRILQRNPRNVWAANGIGAVLSSCNYLAEGEAIFKQIVESGNHCTAASLNSAHVALELGQFKLASQTYKLCLRDFLPENCVEVMHYLARSLYGQGKSGEAKMWLLKARHLAPQDPLLMFNLALTIKKETRDILAMPKPEWDDLQRAELELNGASRYFSYIHENPPNIPARSSARASKDCQNLMAKLKDHLEQVRSLKQSDEQRIRLQEQRFQEHQRNLEEQRVQRQEEERVLRENQMAKRREVLERIKKIVNAPLQSEVPKKDSNKAKGRGRKNKQDVEEEVDQDSRKSSAKKPRKRAAAQELVTSLNRKPKSKEFISSDENSDSDEGKNLLESEPKGSLETNDINIKEA